MNTASVRKFLKINRKAITIIISVLLIGTSSFYAGRILEPTTLPASPRFGQACSYYIYLDPAMNNRTLAKNCITGANDFSEADSATLLQDVANYIATVPYPSTEPPGGIGQGVQFKLVFGVGDFYIRRTLSVNFPGGPNANALGIWGQGEDKTSLILSNGVNNNMFNFTNIGDKLEIGYLKFFGNKSHQLGTSSVLYFQSSDAGGEFIFYHDEFRDCLTSCVVFNNANVQWNTFDEIWMLNSPIGIDFQSTRSDIRVTGSKFHSITAIQFDAGNSADIDISASNFIDAGVKMNSGTTNRININGNIFDTAPNNCLNFVGTGLGNNFDFQGLIVGNIFRTTTSANAAIYLGRYVDGISIKDNEFDGYANSTTPITLIQTVQKTNTFILNNRGYNPQGWATITPVFPSPGANQTNNNPYPVFVYITGIGTGISAYGVTDPRGTLHNFTTNVSVGNFYRIEPYGKIQFTYTGNPTWAFYGL